MLKELKVKDILKITGGDLLQGDLEFVCGEFNYDTRIMRKSDTYIGIKADTIDGSQYWEEAFKNGGEVVIINKIKLDKEALRKWSNKTIIVVDNTLEALKKIATYKRDLYGKDLKVIAITGSVGKTSTKDMIASVVSQKYKTLKTMGNYNNHIGVPLTLLRLTDEEVAVVEMGMNHFGEIRVLTNIAKPNLAVITNIGTSHIGNLGSRENILKSKLEILEGMQKKEIIINCDNDLLDEWNKENLNNGELKIHCFGIENRGEVWADNIILEENSSEFNCHVVENGIEKSFLVKVPVGGVHFVYNALCATLVGKILGIENEKIKNGIESFSLTKKRMEVENLKNGVTVINDAYNASFESITAVLRCLDEYKGRRKIAVLGDVFELGNFAEEMHRKIGDAVLDSDVDILLCCGDNAKFIFEQVKKVSLDSKKAYYFENKDEILKYLIDNVKSGDVILFKASNGMKFFEIAKDYVKSEKNK